MSKKGFRKITTKRVNKTLFNTAMYSNQLRNLFEIALLLPNLIIVAVLMSNAKVPSAEVVVKFTNLKEVPVKISRFRSGAVPKVESVLNASDSGEIRCPPGQRLQVSFADDAVLYFEATEAGMQEVVLGKTHSTFRLYGWHLHVNDKLWTESPELTRVWFDLMVGQLNRVIETVPSKALTELQKVPIWVNPPYKNFRPTAEYHPSAVWLEQNDRNPAMSKSIEITTVENFAFENVRMPYLMLHELAHAYHDRVLSFRHPGIRAHFDAAKKSGNYKSVDRFTGRRIIKDKAYAMSNDREYFAESSEAFFGKNDFFPFNRQQLQAHDRPMHDLLAKLWGVEAE